MPQSHTREAICENRNLHVVQFAFLLIRERPVGRWRSSGLDADAPERPEDRPDIPPDPVKVSGTREAAGQRFDLAHVP